MPQSNCSTFKTIATLTVALSALIFAPPTHATASNQSEQTDVMEQLRQCQSITINEARLSCFDRSMAAFEAASNAGELAVINRRTVEETNRRLFGFNVPYIQHIFNNNNRNVEITEIETTLISAERQNNGRWLFHLNDGSSWIQTSNTTYAIQNRAGNPVKIRRASMNSYLMSSGKSRGIRVQRQ